MEEIFNEVMRLEDALGVRGFTLESDSCKSPQWVSEVVRDTKDIRVATAGMNSVLLTRMRTDLSKERTRC